MAIVDGTQRGNRVNEEEGSVPYAVDCFANCGNVGGDACRGIVVDHTHRLDGMVLVFHQRLLDFLWLSTLPPASR